MNQGELVGSDIATQPHDQSSPAPVWTPRNVYVLLMLGTATAFSALDRFLFGLLAPLIKQDLGLSDTVIGLLGGIAFAATYALAAIPLASLADRWNRRRLIAIGFATWSVMTALCGAAQTAAQMFFARGALGAAEATASPPANSIIGDIFPVEHRPLALAVFSALTPLGFLLAFPLLGAAAQDYGWRTAFYIAGVTGVVLALLFYVTVQEPQRPRSSSGAPYAAASMGQALRALFGTPTYVFGVVTLTLYMVNTSAMQAWLPSFLERTYDLNTAETGKWIGLLRGSAGLVGNLFAGAITLQLARRNSAWLYRVPTIALAMMIPTQILLLAADNAYLWKIGLGVETFFSLGLTGPLFAIIMTSAPPNMRAMGFAVAALLGQLVGQSVGPFGVGVLSDLLTPSLGRYGLQAALLVAITSLVGAAAACMAAGRYTGRERFR